MSNLIKFQNKNDTLLIVCDCKDEILLIDYDKEYKLADFCLYKGYNSHSQNRSLWQKIKFIWSVLVKNNQYHDQMVINQNQLKEIYYFLENKI